MSGFRTYTNFNSSFSASTAISDFIITTSEKLKTNSDYIKILKIITKLIEGGTTFMGKGYCISMADIVYTLLKQNDIPCRIVECTLTITDKQKDEIYAVGFTNLKDDPIRTDTHVVVLTQTEIPMLIDISIAHLLPSNKQAIVDEVHDHIDGTMADIRTPTISLLYREKKEYSLPIFHQRSIVDRIQTDNQIFKGLAILKFMIIFAIIISTLNASRGFYDFYKVYITEEDDWGPSGVRKMMMRLDKIEEILETKE